ncbi:MAG: DASS family sodium-coupled anion symporter [Calditrichaeota bacterium]|nr:DASS family sodium-coupled anion symporter [Calditrichota bacterium]
MYHLRQKIGFFAGPFLFVVILLLPPAKGLSPAALKVGAVAALMTVWWISEAIPIPATALLPIALFPALGVLSAKDASAPYAHHLIFLFLGGFLIAIAMEKWNLHRRIALYTIRFVGFSSSRIILGFMVATGFLSMWISNTATTMMMVPIGLAVIKQTTEFIEKDDEIKINTNPPHFKFGTALMLGIAYAASIGGVATIIGTPPNTILIGFIEQTYNLQITFVQWMIFGVPLAIIMMAIAWVYLTKFASPPEVKKLPGGKELLISEIKKLGKMQKAERFVLIVFASVAFLWIARGFVRFGPSTIHDATIAMSGAILLFLIPVDWKKGIFVLDWKSAVRLPWDVIFLFGGGLALARGFNESGLAKWIGEQLTVLQGLNLMLIILLVIMLSMLLTEVTSNTATAAIIIPVMGSVAFAMHVHPLILIIPAGVAASYAFMLPVATPPNAIVFGSRYLTIPQMAKIGVVLNVIGAALITLLVKFVLPLIWNLNMSNILK